MQRYLFRDNFVLVNGVSISHYPEGIRVEHKDAPKSRSTEEEGFDGRREQDFLNPRNHADIMVYAPKEQGIERHERHPFWYARIIGIFHAVVRHTGSNSKFEDARIMDFLWVRWFGRALHIPGGWEESRPHLVGFLEESDEGAFGFINPADVVRGIHLIPAFNLGQTNETLGKSLLGRPETLARDRTSERYGNATDWDWDHYYVNWSVSFVSISAHIFKLTESSIDKGLLIGTSSCDLLAVVSPIRNYRLITGNSSQKFYEVSVETNRHQPPSTQRRHQQVQCACWNQTSKRQNKFQIQRIWTFTRP